MDYGLQRRMNEYLNSDNGPNDFKLVVGLERKEWTLNIDIMSERIDFFKHALTGEFKNDIEQVVYLPSEDAALFGRLIDWAYGHKLKEDDYYKKDAPMEHYLQLAKTYLLAEQFLMEDLQFHLYAEYSQCAKANNYLMSNTEIDLSITTLRRVVP